MPWKHDSKKKQRWRLVRAMLKGKSTVTVLCRQYGISRQTAYKFRRRFEKEGGRGLVDRPRANGTGPRMKRWRRRVLALRRKWPTWGARKLRRLLEQAAPRSQIPSVRTLERWLKRAGLARRRPQRPHRQAEVAANPARNYAAQLRALSAWQYTYNHKRPHESLELHTPAEYYRRSTRVMPTLRLPTYHASWIVRTVHKGQIMMRGKRWTVGRAFEGLPVGLVQAAGTRVGVYFDELRLGELDLIGPRTLDRWRK